ncbi:MAG: dynamin family protein [Ruminococcus flavefaciens]|nr:dynamin family protein [Ruminococcus flavefaciens]MCM1062669.1 dynamin family protein [Eubacterium sp.]
MNYIKLSGGNTKSDTELIKKNIDENNNVVFVYSGDGTLYDYITALHNKGRGLDNIYLYRFKVCYEKTDLKISYSAGNEGGVEITSMSNLIDVLDGNTKCRIVVETDDRVQLAFIVQQLIFIEYPLEKVDILLRKEERDADKTKRLMENIDELMIGCNKAIVRLTELYHQVESEDDEGNPTKTDRLKDLKDALDSCNAIKLQIDKAVNVKLKIAVAASKKAGKSVIVNCFLGEQIAPTSTELATPNNCIYRKSADHMYHLQLEGGSRRDFEKREDIFDVIDDYFREAQNDKEKNYALPDMDIDYVTDENNFSSYTIFDTAGPDAAGTAHSEAAEKAMQKCDVAIFAIDYSKYLTTSEEDYLRNVKSAFTSQNKFHSLIFALNKIDLRYTDAKSPKSFIMSVDFLKTRLGNIDGAYKDCIIFPTSSLEYFSAIEAEKAGIDELNAENKLSVDEMKKVKYEHKNVPALDWLHKHAESLQYYHDLDTVSYDVFKKDSGMSALMSYVSYVAHSRAKDEILNNITFTISSQKAKIQSVLDCITNIETLINADDEKIAEISGIINDYTDSVKEFLSFDFCEDDLAVLDDESILKQNGGSYENMIEDQRKTLELSINKVSVADAMYNGMVNVIWKKIEESGEIDGHQIDKLFTKEDFKELVNSLSKAKFVDTANDILDRSSKLTNEVKKIANNRKQKIYEKNNECCERLLKENINVEFPEFPDFEFATKMTLPDEIITEEFNLNLDLYKNLSSLFEKKFFSNILTWFSNMFGHGNEKDYKRTVGVSESNFLSTCEKILKDKFKNVVYENNIAEILEGQLILSADGYMKDLLNELYQVFVSMNNTYTSCIDRFASAVDDRDNYKAEIDLYNKRKTNIMDIGGSTDEFMQIWNIIVHNVFDDEKTEPAKILVAV